MADETGGGFGVIDAVQSLTDGAKALSKVMAVTNPNTTEGSGPSAKPGFSVSDFVSQSYHEVLDGITQAKQDVVNLVTGEQAATQASIIAGKQQYDAQVQKNNADFSAMAATNADVKTAVARYGVDPHAPSAAISGAADQIQKGIEQFNTRQADIDQRRSVGILDDPIQWLVNQAVVPYMEDNQDSTSKGILKGQNFILSQQTMALDSVKLASATNAADANKLLIAANDKALGDLEEKQAAALKQSATFGLQATTLRESLNKGQFDAAATTQQLKLSQDRMAQDAAFHADTMKQFDITNSHWEQTFKQETEKNQYYVQSAKNMLEERMNKNQNLQQFQGTLDALNSTMGTSITTNSISLMNPEKKSALANAMANMTTGALGNNTAESMDFLSKFGGRGTVGMGYTLEKLKGSVADAVALVQKNPTNFGGKSYNQLPDDTRMEVLQSAIFQNVNRELGNRPTQGGLTSPDPIGTSISLISKVAPNLAKALGPVAAANPLSPTDPQLIYQTQSDRIKKGEITAAQAAKEISDTFKALNSDMYDHRGFKMLVLPPLTSYKALIATGKTPYGSTLSSTLDLANSAAVENQFIRSNSIRTPDYDMATGQRLTPLPQQ